MGQFRPLSARRVGPRRRGVSTLGLVLIVLGLVGLLVTYSFLPGWVPRFWPLLIVALGLLGLFRRPGFVSALDALVPGGAGAPGGAGFPLVVMDPMDGSLNAKQGVPCYAVMLSLLSGPTVADLKAGYVMNLVNGEEFSAVKGGGARHRQQPFLPLPRSDPGRLEV